MGDCGHGTSCSRRQRSTTLLLRRCADGQAPSGSAAERGEQLGLGEPRVAGHTPLACEPPQLCNGLRVSRSAGPAFADPFVDPFAADGFARESIDDFALVACGDFAAFTAELLATLLATSAARAAVGAVTTVTAAAFSRFPDGSGFVSSSCFALPAANDSATGGRPSAATAASSASTFDAFFRAALSAFPASRFASATASFAASSALAAAFSFFVCAIVHPRTSIPVELRRSGAHRIAAGRVAPRGRGPSHRWWQRPDRGKVGAIGYRAAADWSRGGAWKGSCVRRWLPPRLCWSSADSAGAASSSRRGSSATRPPSTTRSPRSNSPTRQAASPCAASSAPLRPRSSAGCRTSGRSAPSAKPTRSTATRSSSGAADVVARSPT